MSSGLKRRRKRSCIMEKNMCKMRFSREMNGFYILHEQDHGKLGQYVNVSFRTTNEINPCKVNFQIMLKISDFL